MDAPEDTAVNSDPSAATTSIDFSKYRTADLTAHLTELVSVPQALRKVLVTVMLGVFTSLILVAVALFLTGVNWVGWIFAFAYALVLGLLFGLAGGILRVVANGLTNIEQILQIVLDTTAQVARDYGQIQSGAARLPSASELVVQVYTDVLLPSLEKAVGSAFGFLATPVLWVYRRTLGSAIAIMVRRTKRLKIPTETEQGITQAVESGMKQISSDSQTIERFTSAAADVVQRVGSTIRIYALGPFVLLFWTFLLLGLIPILVLCYIGATAAPETDPAAADGFAGLTLMTLPRSKMFRVAVFVIPALILCEHRLCRGQELPKRAPLVVPAVTAGSPQPGKRVRVAGPQEFGTLAYHLMYLPADWQPNHSYPVIIEYPGNRFRECQGTMEGCCLGYGITKGQGAIWLCLPLLGDQPLRHQTQWWGDADRSVDYCKQAIENVCQDFGGDSQRLFLAGFSRGSIACNYIGLRDPELAQRWRGFICHSHYDGVRQWGYPEDSRAAAAKRLQRLGQRPQWISHESNVEPTRTYLRKAYPNGRFTFESLPFDDHTDQWVLQDTASSRRLRAWFQSHANPERDPTPSTTSKR